MRIEIKEISFFNSVFTDYFKISKEITIQGITTDSRLVQENDLFIALNGSFVNGNSFNQDVLSIKNTLIFMLNNLCCRKLEGALASRIIYITS